MTKYMYMDSSYTPQHVANYFLKAAKTDGEKLDQLKLIKLVYIAYGWGLAVLDEKLFREPVEAWNYGPVIPSLYHEFKRYGKKPIDTWSVIVSYEKTNFLEKYTPEISDVDETVLSLLATVWDLYKKFSGIGLIRKTHQQDSPWTQVYKPEAYDIEIPDDLIKPHFEKLIRKYLNSANDQEASAA